MAQPGETVVLALIAAFNTPSVPKLRLLADTEQFVETLAEALKVARSVAVSKLQLTNENRSY
ncbi:hypothetical protein [Methylocystis sp. JR02]|uniref:hypothetical protein n=1 Tax=Methylocystis sp. JR02 TaxID=3046284 RepID=UPI0024BA1F7F|nr:hypothetical protein [Methylocystis sp. JR02]MDJ0450783.1 hypothetical protein [Methylocystis sp. JR02]